MYYLLFNRYLVFSLVIFSLIYFQKQIRKISFFLLIRWSQVQVLKGELENALENFQGFFNSIKQCFISTYFILILPINIMWAILIISSVDLLSIIQLREQHIQANIGHKHLKHVRD